MATRDDAGKVQQRDISIYCRAAYGLDACGGIHAVEEAEASDPMVEPSERGEEPPPAHMARRTTIAAVLCKLIIVPAACIPLNFAFRFARLLPDSPIVLMTLNLCCSMPTAATVIAMLMAQNCEATAGSTSAMMTPMYIASLVTMLGVIVLSTVLLD